MRALPKAATIRLGAASLPAFRTEHVRYISALILLSIIGGGVSTPAAAQHATAFDVEDGARSFASYCAACHGPDGNLIPGIDLGHGRFRRSLTDDEIAGIIMNGIPNTAMPATPRLSEDGVRRLVAYLRSNATAQESVAADGDPARGKVLFEGKGECRDCHRVNGVGDRVGPDLSNVGRLRRAAEIRDSLLDPKAEVQPSNRFYRVITADGKKIRGRLLNHDTFTVQLIDTDDQLRSFAKADLREYGFEETPMPSFKKKLSTREIADLVSYLVSLQGADP